MNAKGGRKEREKVKYLFYEQKTKDKQHEKVVLLLILEAKEWSNDSGRYGWSGKEEGKG